MSVRSDPCLERGSGEELQCDPEARRVASFDGAPEALLTFDEQGRLVEFNASAEKLLGCRREHALGRELLDLIVPARDRAEVLARLSRFRVQDPGSQLDPRFDFIALKADGTEFPAELTLARCRTARQALLVIGVSDLSARAQSQRQVQSFQDRLRALMTDLLLVEERERRRLAIDLHDGLSQTIALVKLRLAALRSGQPEALARSVGEIEALIDQANWTVRSITFELSPPVLHDLGLQPAVEWLVENIKTRYGIEIVLEADRQPKPADEHTRVILFRSIRELLINAAKHAQARQVHVRLERDADVLKAMVVDDGIGMELAEASVNGSGLFSIQERLASIGGSLRVESSPGQGTKIHLHAPLSSAGSRWPRSNP